MEGLKTNVGRGTLRRELLDFRDSLLDDGVRVLRFIDVTKQLLIVLEELVYELCCISARAAAVTVSCIVPVGVVQFCDHYAGLIRELFIR